MSHSLIPPSSAHIWGKPGGCTGWVTMSQAYPETNESPEAKEGTAAHEVAARMLNSMAKGNIGYPKIDETVGSVATNGVVITEEMFEGAEMYAVDVFQIMRDNGIFGGKNIGIEKRVEAKKIHDLSYGTADSFIFAKDKRELFIWDFKFGFEKVEVYENWQEINYASGILDLLNIDGLDDQNLTVRMRIVQPRAFHRDGPIREWIVKASDLRGLFNVLSANAHEALGPNAKIRSGSHCKHCTARHACPTALEAGISLYEAASAPLPVELSVDALSAQLAIIKRARKQLEYLESGFEEQVKGLIYSGKKVPGYMVVEGCGHERWARPLTEVLAMGDMLKKDLRKQDAVTPNQARKLGIDETVIMAYSEKPKTGLKVVEDDGRKAKMIFSN